MFRGIEVVGVGFSSHLHECGRDEELTPFYSVCLFVCTIFC